MEIIAYLHFDGRCEEALDFYKEVLDGTVLNVLRASDTPMKIEEKDKGKIMHARLKVGKSVLYLSDSFGHTAASGHNFHLSLQMDDLSKMEEYFTKLSVGGRIVRALEDTFWGARFGMLIDKFGIHWMMNCELKESKRQ